MNWEEIEKLIVENNLADHAAIWASGTDKGKELTSNFAKVQVDARTREIYDSFDADLNELGIDKKGRKTYEAYKDEYMSLKSKVGDIDALNDKIKELESKGADESLLAQIDALTLERNNFQDTIDTLKREAVDTRKLSMFDAAMSGLEWKDDLPKDLLQLKIDSERSKFLANSEIDGEQLRIKNENGEIWLNNEHKPIDAQSAIKEIFSPYLSSGDPKGVNPDLGQGAQGASALSVHVDLASLKGKSLIQATEALTDAYIKAGKADLLNSEAFTKDFSNIKTKI